MSLKHVLLGAAILAACMLGGLWLFLRQQPPSSVVSGFQASCVEGQRRSISGGVLPLDDETEARLLAFCGCVEHEVRARLSQQDVAAIGLDQSSQALERKLAAIFSMCRQRHP